MKTNYTDKQERLFKRLLTGCQIRLDLAKAPKCFLISVSSLFTFIIKTTDINLSLILTGFSVFILTCGGATLNNYQDRHLDLQMQRTQNRPLPSQKISHRETLVQAVFLIFLGMVGLYLIDAYIPLPLLGAAAILSYNFIYTPLKTKSMLAIFPGAVCGMLPPCIGWLAAGGNIDSLTLWSVMAMFGLWQLPHYWLILLHHRQDYHHSKIPNMLNIFSVPQLRKILFVWVVVFAVMSFALPMSNAIVTDAACLLLLFNAGYLTGNFAYQFFVKSGSYNYKNLLVHLNVSIVFVMFLGALDRLILFSPILFK